MSVKNLSRLLLVSLACVAASRGDREAGASPIYTVTNLGDSYQLLTDAGGHARGVAGAGGEAYAFDKSPVTPISERHNGQNHAYSFTEYTLQNGSHQVGYAFDYGGGLAGTPLGAGINYPTFETWSNGWFVQGGSPVSDLNARGQAVGVSELYSSLLRPSPGVQTYAAFSDPNGASHGFGAATVDNLNNYIAGKPGVDLTSAVQIDDLGQIIAKGTLDGKPQDFLLTPDGPPIPAPEPSTLAILGCAASLLGIRRAFRRSRSRVGR